MGNNPIWQFEQGPKSGEEKQHKYIKVSFVHLLNKRDSTNCVNDRRSDQIGLYFLYFCIVSELYHNITEWFI